MTGPARASGRRLRTPWTLAFWAAVAVQLVVLYVPRAPATVEVRGIDKVIHVLVFAAPTLAGLLAGFRARYVVGGLALHALLSEPIQSAFLPERDGSVTDLVADLTGVLLAWAVYAALRRARRW